MTPARSILRTTISILVLVAVTAGCAPQPAPVGSDSPVTVQRLTNARLEDIRRDVSWSFGSSVVVIENAEQPIPADLVEELLADGSTPTRIEATWGLDAAAESLTLSAMSVDGEDVELEATLPIRPAGPIRVNLGSRQYNVFPGRAP